MKSDFATVTHWFVDDRFKALSLRFWFFSIWTKKEGFFLLLFLNQLAIGLAS